MINRKLPNRKTIRLKDYDYRSEGFYFITICTLHKKHFFGKIRAQKMELSPIGELAQQCWDEIPAHHSNIKLHAFQIMPNHIHGIIEITSSTADASIGPTENPASIGPTENPACIGPTENTSHIGPTENTSHIGPTENSASINTKAILNRKMALLSPKSGSVSRIIGSYKSAVTRLSRKLNPEFSWQSKFYDHIIRNQRAFENIHNYIINNPRNWERDKFSKE